MFDLDYTAFQCGGVRPPLSRYDAGVQAVQVATGQFHALCQWAKVRRLIRRLFGKPSGLLDLAAVTATHTIESICSAGVQTVPIRQIRGSECRSTDFDADFRPVRACNRERWVSVAAARRVGTPLPAISVIQVGDIYFVRDGHHRVSVARVMGQEFIEADVTAWTLKVRPTVAAVPVLVPAS